MSETMYSVLGQACPIRGDQIQTLGIELPIDYTGQIGLKVRNPGALRQWSSGRLD